MILLVLNLVSKGNNRRFSILILEEVPVAPRTTNPNLILSLRETGAKFIHTHTSTVPSEELIP